MANAAAPATAFMAAGVKAAAFAALIRVVVAGMGPGAPAGSEGWVMAGWIFAVLTMTVGNFIAIVQTDIKRMLAYSSIGHAGYLLIALVCRPERAVSAIVFYLAAYAFMTVGAFVVAAAVGRGDVLDEAATWDALNAGRLGGLGIDVWWVYPDDEDARRATLPSRRPFHLHPDVVLSPHRANAVQAWQRASVLDVFATLEGIVSGDAASLKSLLSKISRR